MCEYITNVSALCITTIPPNIGIWYVVRTIYCYTRNSRSADQTANLSAHKRTLPIGVRFWAHRNQNYNFLQNLPKRFESCWLFGRWFLTNASFTPNKSERKCAFFLWSLMPVSVNNYIEINATYFLGCRFRIRVRSVWTNPYNWKVMN